MSFAWITSVAVVHANCESDVWTSTTHCVLRLEVEANIHLEVHNGGKIYYFRGYGCKNSVIEELIIRFPYSSSTCTCSTSLS